MGWHVPLIPGLSDWLKAWPYTSSVAEADPERLILLSAGIAGVHHHTNLCGAEVPSEFLQARQVLHQLWSISSHEFSFFFNTKYFYSEQQKATQLPNLSSALKVFLGGGALL